MKRLLPSLIRNSWKAFVNIVLVSLMVTFLSHCKQIEQKPLKIPPEEQLQILVEEELMCTPGQFSDNQDIHNAIEDAYEASNPNNLVPGPSGSHERGGWILERPNGEQHAVAWRTKGTNCYENEGCSLEPDYEILEDYPEDKLVGWYHIHPLSVGTVLNPDTGGQKKVGAGPSLPDIWFGQDETIPGLIRTPEGRYGFGCCSSDFNTECDENLNPKNADPKSEENPDGIDYLPDTPDPLEAGTGGEPHIKTFDKFGYDFQAIGDYVLVRSTQPNDDFEIQGRIIPFIPLQLGDNISVYEAIAIKVAGTVVEFYSSSSGSIEVRVDGTVITDFPHELPLITVERNGSDASLITSFGHKVSVSNYVRDGSGLISAVSLEIPGSYEGQIEGLLGNGNNDISDELQTRYGVILPTNATDSLYFGDNIVDYFAGPGGDTYRDSWSLFYGASQSLFTQGTDPFSRTYPRSFFSLDDFNAQKVEEAQAACEAAGITDSWALRSCTFDVTLTEDLGWIGVYQGLEFSSDLLRITPTFSVVDSGLPTTLNFDVTSFEGGVITDPGDLSWELYGPDLDTTALSINDATAQFTTTGERGEYTLIVSRISDPSRTTTATVVVADPLAVYPTRALMMVRESQSFEASIDDGLSVGWSTQFGSTVQNGLSVTYTAPSTPNADTLIAFVQEDTSKQFDVPITVINDKLTPPQTLVSPNGNISFIWEGAEALPIIWTASAGTITPDGIYTVPSTLGTYTITATLAQDSTVSLSATVQVVNNPLTVQPTEAIVVVNESETFEASIDDGFSISWSARFGSTVPNDRLVTYTAPSFPAADTLTASAQGDINEQFDVPITVIDDKLTAGQTLTSPGGNISLVWRGAGALSKTWTASAGTVTTDGVYTAPSTTGTYTVTATLVQDSTVSASATVQVVDPLSIELVTLSADGTQSNGFSDGPSITADGRYVVFNSSASTLVLGDANGKGDVFLKDLNTGNIQLVSVAADGTQGNDSRACGYDKSEIARIGYQNQTSQSQDSYLLENVNSKKNCRIAYICEKL